MVREVDQLEHEIQKHYFAEDRLKRDKKKRIGVIPGSENLDVPIIEKRRAQILTVNGDLVSVMDLENFETLNLPYDEELKDKLSAGQQVEYWDIEGQKVVMRASS